MGKKRTLTIVIPLGLVLIVAVTVIITMSYINTPSVGKVTYPDATVDKAASFNLSPVKYVGNYASFSYPKSLAVYKSSSPVTPVLANYDFIYRNMNQWFLAIAILNIPGGNLESNNAYQVRQLKPDTYQPSDIKVHGQEVKVMTEIMASGYSKVAFLITDKYQATISLTADNAVDANLNKTLTMVLNSWQWR